MTSLSERSKNLLNTRIKSLLFETDMSISAISRELCITYSELDKALKKMGLSWIKDHKKKMSKGQTLLTCIMNSLLPGEKIVNEFHLGERLKLDVYCPSYRIGLEYHGIQHFEYNKMFFESREEFLEAQKRDQRKIELCKQQNILLVVFRYNDKLTEEAVYDRLLTAIRSSSYTVPEKKKSSVTNNAFYKEMKKKKSEYNKKMYKRLREKKKKNGRNSK
jgi:hypothetical protein